MLINKLRKKRLLLPILIFILELAAYAQKKGEDKGLISGHLQSAILDETSGVAASWTHPDIYYIHNDSGDTSRFFAINPQGQLKGTYYYKGESAGKGRFGVMDCEDIAVGPGPQAGKGYVYVGDIGDNNALRKHITVYRIPEPALTDSSINLHATQLYLKYPDGPKDAETMMVDPVDKLLYIVSKRRGSVNVYTAPLNYQDKDTVTLTRQCQLHFKGLQPLKWIVGGDIAKDGSQILLKSYAKVYYWKRTPGQPAWQAMQQKPQELPYEQEPQGEAIGFAPDGKSYYTISEKAKAAIYHYPIPQK
ncbi:hypothetical protein KHS38_09440 [Mucilaginibacter sp. Bleaf8]|uniref:hypothetical protein n=1 Tax=Mucilaginibacter sp. Bleaf8 TaxID=2834430 RepID=UPI001BCD39AB|nr:hypothetical protein [Mucilaginibacter sp. Bleaf8]MBS7564629.1 hypothetical protein [Mucilaginibacter sp. Bleaf8]